VIEFFVTVFLFCKRCKVRKAWNTVGLFQPSIVDTT